MGNFMYIPLKASFFFSNHFTTFSFLRFYLLIFRHMGRKGERGRETWMYQRCIDWLPLTGPQPGAWPSTLTCALTGNGTCDLWFRSPVLSPLSHTSQGSHHFHSLSEVLSVSPDLVSYIYD